MPKALLRAGSPVEQPSTRRRRVRADRKPADSVPFSISMPRAVYDQLRVIATKEDRSISATVRRLIERDVREAEQSLRRA